MLTSYDAYVPFSLLCSLRGNDLLPEGCKVIAAVLAKTQITSLKCASHPAQRLNFAWDAFAHGLASAARNASSRSAWAASVRTASVQVT